MANSKTDVQDAQFTYIEARACSHSGLSAGCAALNPYLLCEFSNLNTSH